MVVFTSCAGFVSDMGPPKVVVTSGRGVHGNFVSVGVSGPAGWTEGEY